MKEIDQMLNQWIHSSIIRAKLRELIVKENFKSFDLGVEHENECNNCEPAWLCEDCFQKKN